MVLAVGTVSANCPAQLHSSTTMAAKIVLTCALFALATQSCFAGIHGGYYSQGPALHVEEHHAPSPYSFKYGVHDAHTGDVKSASEHGDGAGGVKGEYSLVQPDGVTRTVHYTADKHNGFNAHVTLSGHGVHQQVLGHGHY